MIELRVLGGLSVGTASGTCPAELLTQPRRQAVLLYLALALPVGFHSRDSLVALLWPESDAASARHSLRNALHELRRSLGDDVFLSRGRGQVAVDSKALRCDALELRRLLAAGRREDALAGWTGEPAAGFHVSGAPGFERWLDELRSSLRGAVVAGAWCRVDELAAAGDLGAAAGTARRALEIGEVDEAGVRRLMRLLEAAGDRPGALEAYARLTRRLAAEYEIGPSPETSQLARSIRGRAGPPRPAVAPRAIAAATVAVTTIAAATIATPLPPGVG
jgi:DNA-binding SARP family transcriptional activator